MNTIHDRITLEIARGCTSGVPVLPGGDGLAAREGAQSIDASHHGRSGPQGHGVRRDHASVSELRRLLADRAAPEGADDRYSERRVALGLPSLRVETLSPALIEQIRKVRKTSFTIAPEAGTRRLREIINKGNTEEDLIATARRVYEGAGKPSSSIS